LSIEGNRDTQKRVILNNREKVLNMFTQAKYISRMDKVFHEMLNCKN